MSESIEEAFRSGPPHSKALGVTRDEKGMTYIFSYGPSNTIIYLKGTDTGPYGVYTVATEPGHIIIKGGGQTLSSMLWSDEEVQIYYVDDNNQIKSAWWETDHWNVGFINAYNYHATPGTSIYCLGFQELHPVKDSDIMLKVYFTDLDNHDRLSVAYYQNRKWQKKVVQVLVQAETDKSES